jgi:FkbM family methyltransferase
MFKRLRPRDAGVCAVVSNEERPITFTVASTPELSTVSPEFERARIGNRGVRKRIQTDAVRLERLLREHQCPSRFGLLSIDCEGHDFEVLQSFSMDEFRPRVVIVEMHGFMPGQSNPSPTYQYLVDSGYVLMSYSVMNGVFCDREG